MMDLLLLAAVLLTSVTMSECLTCFCHDETFANLCPPENNNSCVTDGQCVAEFTRRNNAESRRYKCADINELLIHDFCSGIFDTVNSIFMCCKNDSFCNYDLFSHLDPFSFATTTEPVTVPTGDSNLLVVKITVPISIIVLVFIVAVVTIIILVALIRCRKKKMERARRGEIDSDLSCDPQLTFPLDEYTDPSGSGFGMPHLEQRTLARSVKIGELIGTGRYGQVMLGDYQGERVAVKKFLSIDGQSWQRETEVYTTTLLTHDAILRFVGSDMISNNGATELWLITQYHQHGSLYDYLNKKELTDKVLIRMMVSICSGLSHLHTELHGTIKKPAIAHRDIKTKNILVKNDLKCCIADFGLAVLKGNDDKLNVPKNPKQGTKRYMAPEILNEMVNMNYFESFQHTDIYALGLVMWEMCRRMITSPASPALDYEPPFYGLVPPDPSFEDMKRVVVVEKRQPFIPPQWLQEQLLKNLVQLMRECWSFQSDARPSAVYLKKKLTKLAQEDKLDHEKAME